MQVRARCRRARRNRRSLSAGRMQRQLDRQADDINIPLGNGGCRRGHFADIARRCEDRNETILRAHETGHYSYSEISGHFKVHFSPVGRIVRTGSTQEIGARSAKFRGLLHVLDHIAMWCSSHIVKVLVTGRCVLAQASQIVAIA